MKQCFGYLRVSTTKQGDGVSLEAQKEFILAYAARNDITIIRWFEEKETAAKQGRPVFNAMVRAIKRGQAAGFVAHKIDRSARNFTDWARIGDLSDAGYEIHFASETMDFRSRGGRLSADVQAVIATDYIRNLREEVKKGIAGRLKQGLYPFGAPCGYLNNGTGKVKTPDPARAHLIVQALELYATGTHSIRSLQAEMTRRGLTNRNGRPPSKPLIESILSNPFYCGIILIRRSGETYKGIHEPLISVSLFERVQAVKSGKAGKKITRHNHLYRGLFRCAGCGRSMIPELQKGHVYYRCQTRSCPTKTVREDAIEARIIKRLTGLRLSKAAIERLVAQVTRWVADYNGSEQDELNRQRQFTTIEQRLENLTDAFIDKHIDHDTYQNRRQSLLLEKRKLEEEAQKIADWRDAADQVRRFLELVKTLTTYYRSINPDEQRQFVESAFSNRTVRGKSVELVPSDWLMPVQNAAAVGCGRHSRPNSRSGSRLTLAEVEALVTAVYSDEVQAFWAKGERGNSGPIETSARQSVGPRPLVPKQLHYRAAL